MRTLRHRLGVRPVFKTVDTCAAEFAAKTPYHYSAYELDPAAETEVAPQKERPKVLILVGQLAIARFLGRGSLEDRVGKRFGERPVMIPLPHPSGQSRWLNEQANRDRLANALALIGELRANFAR